MMSIVSNQISIRDVYETEDALILRGYTLLQEAIGVESVEDLRSFRDMVSSVSDDAAIPKMICATSAEDTIGFIVGTYLSNLNMGFIAYSAVHERWRGRGVYTDMRHRILELFDQETGRVRSGIRPASSPSYAAEVQETNGREHGERILYVISELDQESQLYGAYLNRWGAVVAPCAYEQPEVQGLKARDMNLVLQPVARRTAPGRDETLAIVREVYERIYRIHDVAANPSFRRIASSLRDAPLSAGKARAG